MHRPLDYIFQLSDVSWPSVTDKCIPGRAAERNALAVMVDEMFGQCFNILGPSLAQRRQGDLNNVQAVEQIFAEPVEFNHFIEVHMGCGDNSGIGAYGPARTYALYLSCLQNPEQFNLHVMRHIANFIQ
jgi:hypothetical protein